MSIIRLRVNQAHVQPPSADGRIMVAGIGYDSGEHTRENVCARDVLFFDSSLDEVRSFAQAILDALPQPPLGAQANESTTTDFRAYQGIPGDIDWL